MLGATSGSTFTYGGVLSGSSHLQISAGQSGGAGVVTLTNQNTYLGDTWLNTATDGVLRMGASNALPAGTTVRFSQSAGGGSTAGGNGTIDLGGQATSVGALQGGGRGVANTTGAATLTIGKTSGTDTFSGVIGIPSNLTNLAGANNQISLVKTGANTQILTGANTYSGGTTVSGGTLQIGAGGTLGGSSGSLLINGGILDLGNTTQTVGSASITSGTVQNGILNFGSLGIAGNSTVSIGLTGNGNLNITGGTVNLLSAETFSGLTNVNGGVVQLSSNLPGGLTMGAGTLNVTNTSFTVGSMTITGGTSTFAGSVAAGSVNISGNSSTSFAGNVTASGEVSISGGTIQTNGNSISGSTVTQSGGSVTGGGSVTATSAYIFDNSGAASSSASYGGPAAVNLTGGGNTTLSGNNTYTGTTSISNGSTLTAGSNTAISPNSALSFGSGTNTLDLAGNSAFITSLNGGSGNVITSTGGTATIHQGNFDGTIQGGLGVTTTGAVTLGGANTYTGATQVNGGTLAVDGSLANTTVTVADGAKLGGSGTIGGGSASVVIQSGGTYSPGHSPGFQTIQGSLEFLSGSIFEWDLNASTDDPGEGTVNSGTFDHVAVNGSISGLAVFQIVLGTNSFSSPFWDTEKKWTGIFTGSGAPANLAAIFPTFGGAVAADGKVAGQGQFSFNNSGTLTWTAVPELSNILIGGLMGLGMIRRGRRA
jgi:autotransporter-associated beta strand protein